MTKKKKVSLFSKSKQGADADRAFTSLRSSSFRGDAGAVKYGQLLSMLLTKSWPKTSQNRSGLDPSIVEFLLTWNPMAGYFQFFGNLICSVYISFPLFVSCSLNESTQNTRSVKSLLSLKIGDESGRGRILTDDGQETLSMAQSVLTALVASISNASVTVEILVLLQKYRDKFLELLLKTTYPSAKERTEANTRQQGEKILDERIGEMEEFQAVKQKVVSFVNMCDLIGPGEISLSSKEVLQSAQVC